MDFITLLFYVSSFITLFMAVSWFVFYEEQDESGTTPPLTFVVPAHNEEKALEKCVKSLIRQNYPNMKIFIVDDHSTDRTWEIGKKLEKQFSNVKIVKAARKGKANAMNQILFSARTPLFGFIDADSWIEHKILKRMARAIGDSAGVVSYMKPHSNSKLLEKIQEAEYFMTAIVRTFMSGIGIFNMTPGFGIFKTDVLKKAGGFDPDTLTEDVDMGMRLVSLGHTIKLFRGGYARTIVPSNFRDFVRQRVRWYYGLLEAAWKYRKTVLLNIELQIFSFWVYFISIAITTVFAFNGLVNQAQYVYRTVSFYSRTGFDWSYIIHSQTFHISSIFPLALFSFLSGIFLIYAGMQKIDRNLSLLEFLLYFPIYPFLQTFLWAVTIISAIKGDIKW